MAQKNKEEEVVPAGQEEVKPLTTKNAVVEGVGTLVRPKEDTVIVGTKKSLLGDGVEHTVHRVLAEKLIKKGQATEKKDK